MYTYTILRYTYIWHTHITYTYYIYIWLTHIIPTYYHTHHTYHTHLILPNISTYPARSCDPYPTYLYLDHMFYLYPNCTLLVKPYTKRYNSLLLNILVYFCHLIHFIVLCLYHHTIPYIMKDTLSHFLHFPSFHAIHAIHAIHYCLIWYPGILVLSIVP